MSAHYTLYWAPGAASMAVHWMLIETGAAHALQLVDLKAGQQRHADYLRLNPNGVVPTLMVDGAPVYECAALLLLLAERHPQANLRPLPGTRSEALYLQWMLHFANTLQPAFRAWFYPAEPAGDAAADAAKRAAQARIEAAWDRLEAHLAAHGPWIAGEQFTAVDFLGAMLMRWSRNMPRPATTWPTQDSYVATIKARPSFKLLYEREGLTEWS